MTASVYRLFLTDVTNIEISSKCLIKVATLLVFCIGITGFSHFFAIGHTHGADVKVLGANVYDEAVLRPLRPVAHIYTLFNLCPVGSHFTPSLVSASLAAPKSPDRL